MKGLRLLPQELELTGSSRVHSTLFRGNSISQREYICWGFISQLTAPFPTHLGYAWTPEQYQEVVTSGEKGAGAALANRYLEILEEVGVAQWFIHSPKKIQDFKGDEVFLKISTDYPSAMIVGLMEMYRNLLYTPMWCYYVVTLNREFGFSAIESILACKLLYLNCSVPAADALSYSRYDEIASYSYPLDVFSEKNILLCSGLWVRGSMKQTPVFEGVYRFFNKCSDDSFRRTPTEPLEIDVHPKYLQYLGDVETSGVDGAERESIIPLEVLNKIKQFLRRE